MSESLDIDSPYMLPYRKLTYQQAAKSSPLAASQWGRCMGLIEGADMLRRMRKEQIVETTLDTLCADIPESVEKEQAMRVVVRYAEQHPEQTHHSLWLLAIEALHNAWPCQK